MTKKLEITFEWENNNFFEMSSKYGEAPSVSIIKVEENSNIGILWGFISKICSTQINTELSKIGEEMKES